MIKTVFFDLDSTLLQMDQNVFLKLYFKDLGEIFSEKFGYDKVDFLEKMEYSVQAMIKNDGNRLNECAFWETFHKFYDNILIKDTLNEYYNTKFDDIKKIVNYNELSKKIVLKVKELGYRVVLATNPLFPLAATQTRMKWAGLDYDLFEYVTTYENSSYSKPNGKYYLEICDKLGLNPSEVIMIGNDMKDDFKYIDERFKKYIVTDYLINEENKEIDFLSGSLSDLYNDLESILGRE